MLRRIKIFSEQPLRTARPSISTYFVNVEIDLMV